MIVFTRIITGGKITLNGAIRKWTDMYAETLEWRCTGVLTDNSAEEAAQWLQEAFTNACDMSMLRIKKIKKN